MKRFSKDVQEYEVRHAQLVRSLAPECALFFKRSDELPVEPCSVNLYGNGARRTVKGGKGSGDVNSRHCVSVEEGLENAGFTVTTKGWLDAYDALAEKAKVDFLEDIKREAARLNTYPEVLLMERTVPPIEYSMPLDGKGEINVYVIARDTSEGFDNKAIKGGYYLADSELKDIKTLSERKEKFILVLNTGCVIDITPVLGMCKNILLLGQLGAETGNVLADILTGRSYPSGKLAATWAEKLEDYPSKTFGEKNDIEYSEGEFVGYRYFEAFGVKTAFGFGFGLGYTDFTVSPVGVHEKDGEVTVTVKVKNTGNFRGKEVVQLYVQRQGGDKNYRSLIAFAKTDEVEAKGECLVKLKFNVCELAEYDGETSSFRVYGASYDIFIGNSLITARCALTVTVDGDTVCEEVARLYGKQVEELAAPEYCAHGEKPELGDIQVKCVPVQRKKAKRAVCERIKQMTDDELINLCVGVKNDMTLKSVIGASAKKVAGAAGETYSDGEIEALSFADGTAGLRLSPAYQLDEEGNIKACENALAGLLPGGAQKIEGEERVYYQYCTAIPVGTALAQSWNIELCEKMGDTVGEEMDIFDVDFWLAPALNIQRHPLCGRDFEYYSEDPVLSGNMSAAVVRGVQAHKGRYCTVKHFACNNQEYNRFFSNSIINERALREIYLKSFEICIEKSDPGALMSSYNLVNGKHTANSEQLIKCVLRGEWGYDGLIMTDWMATGGMGRGEKYDHSYAGECIAVGNDLMMPGLDSDKEDIKKGLAEGTVARSQLEECAFRIYRFAQGKKGIK